MARRNYERRRRSRKIRPGWAEEIRDFISEPANGSRAEFRDSGFSNLSANEKTFRGKIRI